jgi:cytochrome P450
MARDSMSDGLLLTTPSATITFDRYEDVREALFNPDLSRSFDKRSYDAGNIRDGVVSISHGAVHRARRRVENSQFRPDVLRLYEHDLFPRVMEALLDTVIDREDADLYAVGELLSVVLASRRAGIDVPSDDLDQLTRLVGFVDVFSQGSAILDAKDPAAVRALVRATYEEFERDFVRPAWDRRQALLDQVEAATVSEEDLPHDILTVLLRHRTDPLIELDDDGRIVREVATYLQGGTHTSGQTVVNAFDLIFAMDDRVSTVERLANDRLYAQRVVHETLRLRPTTPKMKRRAEADTTVGGRDPEGRDRRARRGFGEPRPAAVRNRSGSVRPGPDDRRRRSALGPLVRLRTAPVPGSIGRWRVPGAGRVRRR